MKKYFILLLLITGMQLNGFTQKIQSPSEFLGYKLGEQFTPHYRVVEYYKYLASVSKNIKLQDYGKTNEGRPLFLAFVGSDSNISRLDEIRKNNMSLTGIKEGLNTSKPLEGLKGSASI
jgi:hypothetical protein